MQRGLKTKSGVISKCNANCAIMNTFLLPSDILYLIYILQFLGIWKENDNGQFIKY